MLLGSNGKPSSGSPSARAVLWAYGNTPSSHSPAARRQKKRARLLKKHALGKLRLGHHETRKGVLGRPGTCGDAPRPPPTPQAAAWRKGLSPARVFGLNGQIPFGSPGVCAVLWVYWNAPSSHFPAARDKLPLVILARVQC